MATTADLRLKAFLHTTRGRAYTGMARIDAALTEFQLALALADELGDPRLQAQASGPTMHRAVLTLWVSLG